MAKDEEKREYAVTIIRQRPVTLYPRLGVTKHFKRIVYVAEGLPPATIDIPSEEYTDKLRNERIREDIERRLKEQPETIKV